jgi:hypothetical protein
LLLESKAPIDLITFSACQTAAGNERSLLGLAGVAYELALIVLLARYGLLAILQLAD